MSIYLQFFIILFVLIILGYIMWLTICFLKLGKWNWVPCFQLNKGDSQVTNIKISKEQSQYIISWDPPTLITFGGLSYNYYLWDSSGNYNSSTTNPKPIQQDNNITATEFIIDDKNIFHNKTYTIIIVTNYDNTKSKDVIYHFEIPDPPIITDIFLQNYNKQNNPIKMDNNPIVNVQLKNLNYPITDTDINLDVQALAPQQSKKYNPIKCTTNTNPISCQFQIDSQYLYGGTKYIPSAKVGNIHGESPISTSKYSYVEESIRPNPVSNITFIRKTIN